MKKSFTLVFFGVLASWLTICLSHPMPLTSDRNVKCGLFPDPGPCLGYFQTWYFDTQSGVCEQFIYGGCMGNENRFWTQEECERECSSVIVNGKVTVQGIGCSEPPETGVCRAYFPSYYYDTRSGTCEQFIYGGCGGNANRYETKEECEKTCLRHRKVTVQLKNGARCLGPAEPGLCLAYIPSWYYDTNSGTCEQFIYGGCGGNANRYETKEECEGTCVGAEF